MITVATLGENLMRQYWKPKAPKDKRLRLMPANEQAKQHLEGKAKHRGIKYTTKEK